MTTSFHKYLPGMCSSLFQKEDKGPSSLQRRQVKLVESRWRVDLLARHSTERSNFWTTTMAIFSCCSGKPLMEKMINFMQNPDALHPLGTLRRPDITRKVSHGHPNEIVAIEVDPREEYQNPTMAEPDEFNYEKHVHQAGLPCVTLHLPCAPSARRKFHCKSCS